MGGTVLRPMDVPEIPAATAALARKVHPRGTDEMRVRDALGALFRDMDFTSGEFADMYASRGQPGLSPALLLMVTILQFRHNLSDREAAEAVADRIACVRRLNRSETVGEGLRAALEEIARISPGWIVPLLREGWDQRYGRKVETARLLGRKNASAQALAAQIGADGQALLAAVDADPTATWINELPQVKILRILWDQHYTATSTGRLRFKDAAELPTAAQRLHSPYDPDARYSTKGKGGD